MRTLTRCLAVSQQDAIRNELLLGPRIARQISFTQPQFEILPESICRSNVLDSHSEWGINERNAAEEAFKAQQHRYKVISAINCRQRV